MPRIDAFYDWLARDLRPEAVDVLAQALPTADAEYAARIAGILVERRVDTAWAALAGNYLRLPVPVLERLERRSEFLSEGVTRALHDPRAQQRRNALLLLCDLPMAETGHRVAECLLDSDEALHETAAQALYRLAEAATQPDAPAPRGLVGAALREGLRTFERHRQMPVLRAALWFARELGPDLWRALSGTSHASRLVQQHLQEWAEPRMAAFLLLALAESGWHAAAEEVLSQWESSECGVALLAQSDLLGRPEVRRALPRLRTPRWFVTAVANTAELTPAIRATLPHWVAHLSVAEYERWRCLDAWASCTFPELQLAAAHVLAAMGNNERAMRTLARLASGDSTAARFAEWCLTGRRIARERAAVLGKRSGGAVPT